MSENYPLGGRMTFVPDEGTDLRFAPAPITKTDARQIGLDFCAASAPERDALLADLGPVMIRRSLLVLSKLAVRLGDDEAAAYARDLRDQITTRQSSKAVGA